MVDLSIVMLVYQRVYCVASITNLQLQKMTCHYVEQEEERTASRLDNNNPIFLEDLPLEQNKTGLKPPSRL